MQLNTAKKSWGDKKYDIQQLQRRNNTRGGKAEVVTQNIFIWTVKKSKVSRGDVRATRGQSGTDHQH